jgi:alpha-amylase
MKQFCLGFEVHQPYRLNKRFSYGQEDGKDNPGRRYFDPANKEILLRVCDKCYGPTTSLILDQLDDGFACAFSISGVLVEQLEKWAPDVLDLFVQAAHHPRVEMICQTYYHSISSLFWEMDEFREQVSQHRQMLKDVFRVTPKVFENTEFILDNRIAQNIREMGFSACFTEGVDHILKWRSPNYLYQCEGLPLIMRNFKLSDDIAFRFTCRDWEAWPLTADKYAHWVSETPGDFIPVFIDYETIGEHYWADTGILEFFRHLGPELMQTGVEMINPSEILHYPVREEFSVPVPISWADAEKDATAWIENRKQKNAVRAIQRAHKFTCDERLWRCLQISDHFYYMSCKNGSCGEVHSYFSHQPEHQAFITYMDIIADYEEQCILNDPENEKMYPLRSINIDNAFYFSSEVGYTGHVAFDLDQLTEMLSIVPSDSIEFHRQHGDFATWVRKVVKDEPLACAFEQARSRQDLIHASESRCDELWRC